jgi:hypothetical protein
MCSPLVDGNFRVILIGYLREHAVSNRNEFHLSLAEEVRVGVGVVHPEVEQLLAAASPPPAEILRKGFPAAKAFGLDGRADGFHS